MLSLSRRMKEGFLNVPSVLQSPSDKHVVSSESLNEFNQRRSNPAQRVNDVAPSVSRLTLVSGPDTISRLVVPVVVNALNRPSLFARSHVVKKGGERLSPLLTRNKLTAAVVFVAFVLFSFTSVLQAAPAHVGARSFTVAALAVGNIDFLSGATAGGCVTASDGFISGEYFRPAVAGEIASVFNGPVGHRFWRAGSVKCKACVFFSGGEFFSRHNGSGFTVCKWRVSDANLIPAAIINPAICAVNSD